MPRHSEHRLTKTRVERLRKSEIAWDSDVQGFGVRALANGPVYVLKYRHFRRQRWYKIGRHGAPWTVETARREARRLLGEVAAGKDPSERRELDRKAPTIAELCDLYLKEAPTLVLPRRGRPKRESTLATDRGRIERHIKPLLGWLRVDALTREDAEEFLRKVAAGATKADVRTKPRGRAIVDGGKGTATRTLGLLGAVISFAVKRRMRPDNPVHGISRFADRKRERFLSGEEFTRLGAALAQAEQDGEHPSAVAAIRLLALTGCRKSEILWLRWEHVDFALGALRLPDSKTGARVVMLGTPALELLGKLPRVEGNQYVLPGCKNEAPFIGVPHVWQRIRKKANLSDVRLHDLRHSFASMGALAGTGMPLIGRLLGHADSRTTDRYVHFAAHPIRAAANSIANAVSEALSGKKISDTASAPATQAA